VLVALAASPRNLRTRALSRASRRRGKKRAARLENFAYNWLLALRREAPALIKSKSGTLMCSTRKGLLVPNLPLDPKSRGRIFRLVASSLLAGTSIAALLLAAPAKAGQTITTPQATVTNPAGQATTSIVINGTTVTGAVTNAGTISPGTLVGSPIPA
jgi:hypothetical protein